MSGAMPDVHEGGCACGAVRYRALGQPVIAQVCHCRFCQRRTGSAFAVLAVFKDGDVAISRGRLMLCEHRSAGTFDDPGWLRIDRHIWTRSARSWVPIPSGVELFSQAGGPIKQ